VEYLISPKRAIIELPVRLGAEREIARVTYAGGYVLPGTIPIGNQTALPDELEAACIEQTTYWYQRRNQLGLTSISGEGGSIQQFSSLDLLPHIRAILKAYERF